MSGRPAGQERAELRIGILARLFDVAGLAPTRQEVAVRSAAVLRHNDEHPHAWLFSVEPAPDAPRGLRVATDGPALDPASGLLGAAHALAVAAVASGRHEREQLGEGSEVTELHAAPVLEPGAGHPSMVLVVGCPKRRHDAAFADYLTIAAAAIGAGSSGLGELAVERQNSEVLRELDAAKSAFLANISHELRTPVALTDALREDDQLSPDTRRRLKLVRTSATRLNRLVDAMLDFSRMEAGRITAELTEVNLTGLVRSLAVGFGPAIDRAGLNFRIDVANVAPAPAQDPVILERIVLNLLSNALKYTPSGEVAISLRPDGDDGFAIAVADTGIGIAVRDHERVFKRFEQLPSRQGARSTEGAGIGLAMVAELTELLGGGVELRSAPGRGSTFTVRLPNRARTVEAEGARTITPRRVDDFLADVERWEHDTVPAVPGGEDGRPRVMVVDDSPEMLDYLATALGTDYDVQRATGGLQALAAIRAQPPQAVLTDVMMPGLDGYGLVAEIRADLALTNLPVLLISAQGGQEAALAALGHGADDYLVKPFSVPEFRARLASNIARANARSLDASWRRAVLGSMHEALIIADAEGEVTEVNDAFTQLLGFTLDDGPFRLPYPWWPDPELYPDDFERIARAHSEVLARDQLVGVYRLRHRDGRPVWADYAGGVVEYPGQGSRAVIKTLRDATREHRARERRADAARVAADFTAATQLDQLIGIAVDGLHRLFGGEVTLQIGEGRARRLFAASGILEAGDVDEHVGRRLIAEAQSEPVPGPTPGVLLAPTNAAQARAWVQFGSPRVVGTDEQIVADLLAQAFSLAVDRVLALDKQENLARAVESHRTIGQAVGILVERHRITPAEAFQRLRQASKDRNVRLRAIAEDVIETGVDPSGGSRG